MSIPAILLTAHADTMGNPLRPKLDRIAAAPFYKNLFVDVEDLSATEFDELAELHASYLDRFLILIEDPSESVYLRQEILENAIEIPLTRLIVAAAARDKLKEVKLSPAAQFALASQEPEPSWKSILLENINCTDVLDRLLNIVDNFMDDDDLRADAAVSFEFLAYEARKHLRLSYDHTSAITVLESVARTCDDDWLRDRALETRAALSPQSP